MQYLSKNKADKHKYIVSIIDEGDTFSVKFADGTIYDGYAMTEENLKEVSDAMEGAMMGYPSIATSMASMRNEYEESMFMQALRGGKL